MFKKLIIISLILLAIISIGAVSAAENISDTNLKTPEINEKMTIDAEKEIIKEESKESIETYITIKDKVYLDSSHPDIIQVDYVAGASGNITLDIDGEEVYNKQIQFDSIIFANELKNVPSFGLHNLTFKYSGDSNYNPFEKTTVVDFAYIFDAHTYKIDNDYAIEIYLPLNATGFVNLDINNEFYGRFNVSELIRLKFDYDKLSLGNNRIVINYEGDSIFNKRSINRTLYVEPIIKKPDYFIIGEEETFFIVQVPSHELGSVFVKWSYGEGDLNPEFTKGFETNVSISNGIAKIKLPRCSAVLDEFYFKFTGKITIWDYFFVEYVNSSDLFKIVGKTELINGESARFNIFNYYTEGPVYYNFFLDGQLIMDSYLLPDKLNVTIPNLAVGSHEVIIKSVSKSWYEESPILFYKLFNITVKEAVNDGNNSQNATNTSTYNPVNNISNDNTSKEFYNPSTGQKIKVSLVLKSVKVKKSSGKLVLTAILKINDKPAKGEIVTFKFNDKIYKVKTNSKGIAKLKIKNSVLNKLKVGKKTPYKAKYSNQTVKKSAVVKK